MDTEPKGGWRFHRVREDKTEPNAMKTAFSVIESMENSITKEDLLNVCEHFYEEVHEDNSKKRLR
jgi:hypothetical protein